MSMTILLFIAVFVVALAISQTDAFKASAFRPNISYHNKVIAASKQSDRLYMVAAGEENSDAPVSKGFGKPKTVEPKGEEEEKDAGTRTYESQSKRGVPEYNIFLRPANGAETDWVPVGSMTIPRDTKVSKAVYEVEGELLKGTFKLYPKLKAFADVRKNKEGPLFEYGYCLKAFPDEEIKLITPEAGGGGEDGQKNFFVNWLSKLTDPIDNSGLKNSGQMTLKQ